MLISRKAEGLQNEAWNDAHVVLDSLLFFENIFNSITQRTCQSRNLARYKMQTKNTCYVYHLSSLSSGSEMKQLLGIMSEILNVSRDQKRREARIQLMKEEERLEPRDRTIFIELPSEVELSQASLERFVSQLCKKVWSVAFNSFSREELSFQHTKVYASQQILRNLVRLCEKFKLGKSDFEIINKQIQGPILSYMWHKYPMTLSRQINRNLSKTLKQMNVSCLPSNNYLHKVPFSFSYRESAQYNDLIMKTVNEVLKKTNAKISNFTIYQRFQSRINELFELVFDSDYMEEREKEDKDKQKSHQSFEEWENLRLSMTIKGKMQRRETMEECMRVKDSTSLVNKAQYRDKVKSYTSYSIGKKLPESTRPFTDDEVASHNISVENPQVLRLISKWCEQLKGKFQNFTYLQPVMQLIRTQYKGAEVGGREMLECLIQLLKEEKRRIDSEMSQLIENNNMMQSELMKRELNMSGSSQIEKYELIAARYSLDIVNNLHSYTVKYLNRLIHGLLTVTSKFAKNYSTLAVSINLITFQVMDLFRCKCTSGEKEIIRIYNQIMRQTECNDSNLSLVRVVNRLQRGTNDVLINVNYRDVLCEIQLAVKSKNSTFIEYSNAFNHYFYQIKRSLFGPLTQLGSIWKCLDTRFQLYPDLTANIVTSKRQAAEGSCREHSQMQPYFNPFICSLCLSHFYDNVFIKNHLKCKKCDYWVCARCQISRSDCLNILKAAFRQEVVSKCQKIGEQQQIPDFGICVLIHCIETKIEPFKKFVGGDSRIMGVKNKKIYEIFNINSKKKESAFKQNYLIFKIDENYGRKHIKIDEDQVKEYQTQQKLRRVYMKQSNKICINQEKISIEQLASLSCFGNTAQRLNISIVELIGNQLENVDAMIRLFPNLMTLNLSENSLKSVESLKNLSKLQTLVLDSNQLSSLPSQVCSRSKLRELSAAKNQIRQIPSAIGELQELRSLCLNRNRIQTLPKSIATLKLLNLNLSDNQIRSVQDEVCEIGHLQILQVQNNRLVSINPKIKALLNLKWLNLSHNQIILFPEELVQLRVLTKLNLSFNKIREIPTSINQLTSLKELNLSHNEIDSQGGRTFPEITMLCNLLHLDLSHNALETTPKFKFQAHIGALKLDFSDCKLRYLSLSNNKLRTIESFQDLQRLQQLYLNCNQLEHLHQSISSLSSLTKLHLQINSLKDLPCLVLDSLTKLVANRNQLVCFQYHKLKELQELDISDNHLAQMGYNYMPNLAKIQINRNSLELLSLSEYPKIKHVQASHNKMTSFPLLNLRSRPKVVKLDFNLIKDIPEYVSKLSGLSFLSLAQNQIHSIPSQLQKLTSLENRSLQLSGNPIQELGCWPFLLQKGTIATLKYLEGSKKDIRTVAEEEQEGTIGQMIGRESSMEEEEEKQ